MRVIVPDYYDKFQCLAGACPHSCCEKWEVVIDEETVCRYQEVSGELGGRLRAALQYDEEGDACFPLNGGRCPFLDGENLCEIHKQLGEEATSVTCREHPRFTEDYGPFREITLSASCPAANALLLGSEEPLTFREFETEGPEDEGDAWLEYLLPVRKELLAVLADRSRTLQVRLGDFLRLAAQRQAWLDGVESPEENSGLPHLPENVWSVLSELEVLEEDWRDILRAAETAPAGEVSENHLERLAVYFAFRYLLKAVNDGDLLSRAQFVVLAVLAVERLAEVCGLSEALRRFSCEIEHSDENLEALLEAFWQGTLCVLPSANDLQL